MIKFKFNEAKTTQVAALLLKKNNGRMNYMKLIKLLYFIDREALNRWERALTGDSYFSMPQGPVLSKILDKVSHGKQPAVASYWHTYISNPEYYKVSLKREPEFDELSKREKSLILEINRKYKSHSQWDMVDLCHKILPEWEDPGNSAFPIRIEDIFRALNKTEREIEIVDEEISNLEFVEQVLSEN